MSTLYIDRKGSTLQVKDGVIQVIVPNEDTKRSIPLKYVTRIVIRADTEVGSNALCSIADAGISLLIIGGRFGSKTAYVVGAFHNDAQRRWNQTIAISNPRFCSEIARTILKSKISRQLKALDTIAVSRADLRKPLHDAAESISGIMVTLNTDESSTLARLRGLEGAAAAAYFRAYFSAFAPALGATDRNRRPPKDPVNAVLSLSYTLLSAQATTACQITGLDPALGFLYRLSFKRPALSCDLMEPFRPGIDLWVWELFRSETLRPEHFSSEPNGSCLLGKAGRGHFYEAWEMGAKSRERSLHRFCRKVVGTFNAVADSGTWSHLASEDCESISDW